MVVHSLWAEAMSEPLTREQLVAMGIGPTGDQREKWIIRACDTAIAYLDQLRDAEAERAAERQRADRAEADAGALRAALEDAEWALPQERCPECKNLKVNTHGTHCTLGRVIHAALASGAGARAASVIAAARQVADEHTPVRATLLGLRAALSALDRREQPEVDSSA